MIMNLSLSSASYAQEGYELELKALSGIPVGQFVDHLGQTVWGGSLYVSYHPKETPFTIGAQIGIARYGSENISDIPGHPVGPSAGTDYAYSMFLSHAILRYEPSQTRIIPYLEVLVGVKWLFTKKHLGTTTSTPVLIGDWFMMIDSEDTKTVLSSVAPSYGLGGGLKLCIIELNKNRNANSSPTFLYLNLQGRYLFGGKARYLRKGGISFQDSQRTLDIHRSRTDMLFFNIGISLQG